MVQRKQAMMTVEKILERAEFAVGELAKRDILSFSK